MLDASMSSAAPAPTYDPKYPIGPPHMPPAGSALPEPERADAIRTLAQMPEQLRNAVSGLNTDQLNTPYREGGWTLRQVVHHVADSHAQAVFRYRLALTEEWPTVTAFPEAAFARLQDYEAPVEWSLEIVEATHARWVMLLSSLGEAEWGRGIRHSDRGPMRLDAILILYAWHSRHHLAHITHLRAARGW